MNLDLILEFNLFNKKFSTKLTIEKKEKDIKSLLKLILKDIKKIKKENKELRKLNEDLMKDNQKTPRKS